MTFINKVFENYYLKNLPNDFIENINIMADIINS